MRTRVGLAISLLASALLVMPGGTVRAGKPEVVIKLATMAPRTPQIALEAKKANRDLKQATDGRIQFRTYYGGAAGDEQTIMRKLRAGQLDGALFGVQVVSQFVRQAMIFMAPQTFQNYKQVDAVRAVLTQDFNEEAYENGFKISSWWDAGKVRIFSKRPVRTFQDLRSGRPWLYPQSPLLREFYKMINVTGVPLDLPEVYGGLQTDMVDTVWISSVLATAFRWTAKTKYVSATPVNIIQGASVIRRGLWEKLSEKDRATIDELTDKNVRKFQLRFRRDDEKAFKKIQKRGITPVPFAKEEQWQKVGQELRDKMIGRIYEEALLRKVEKIAAKFSDEPSDFLTAR